MPSHLCRVSICIVDAGVVTLVQPLGTKQKETRTNRWGESEVGVQQKHKTDCKRAGEQWTQLCLPLGKWEQIQEVDFCSHKRTRPAEGLQ